MAGKGLIDIIYQDREITITGDFLMVAGADKEAVAISRLSNPRITKEQTGNYQAASILFVIVGIFTVAFMIGWLFIAWGIAAWFSKIYTYHLLVDIDEVGVTLLTSKSRGRLARISRALASELIKKELSLAST